MISRGPTQDLEALARRFSALANEAQKAKLVASLSREAITQVQLGFEQSRDPEGNPWAPLKTRAGKPLLDTGRLRNSFVASVSGRSFTLTGGSTAWYGIVHQTGKTIVPRTKKVLRWKARGGRWFAAKRVVIPARPMLPGGNSLPPIWARAFERVALMHLNRVLKVT